MTERDLQRVLTQSVQDVHLSEEARRSIRQATKEEKPVKSKTMVILVLALLIVLSASVGIAAELGMFDYLNRKFGQDVLPGADSLIREDVAGGENDYATYRIRQAVYDGKSVSLFTEIRPRDEHTLLLNEGWDLDMPYAALVNDSEEAVLADPRTIAEYAADSGMTHIVEVCVNMGANDWSGGWSGSSVWQSNVVTVLTSARMEGDTITLPIEYFAYDHTTGTDQRVQDEITLKAVKPLWTVSSQETFDLPEFGIRVDGVTITGTVLQSYWTLDFTVTDLDKALEAWNPNLLDMEGNYLPTGALGGGGGSLATELGQQLTWDSTFGAMENPPEQLLLLFRMWDESSSLKLPITLK
ncbi:MAG: hypothetical protein ACI4MG_08215 [Aristaeellaceae bacterium]